MASHFYILVESIVLFNEKMKQSMSEAEILSMISESKEFDGIKIRSTGCMLHPVRGGTENPHGKVNILLQSYISKTPIKAFSLSSDSYYVAQNAARKALLGPIFTILTALS